MCVLPDKSNNIEGEGRDGGGDRLATADKRREAHGRTDSPLIFAAELGFLL